MDSQIRQGFILRIAGFIINATIAAVISFSTHLYNKIDLCVPAGKLMF
jgi:hypothetical protein